MSLIKKYFEHFFKSSLHTWDTFWFAPMDLLGLACQRIVLCGTMTYMYLMRSNNLIYFTDASWLPREKALLIFPENIRPVFAWFFWSDAWNMPVHALLVILLLLLTLGIGGRWIMWLAWTLDMGFIQRNFSVNFGADIICSLFLFYMSFSQSCERLSVVNVWRKKKVHQQSDFLSSAIIRMMQIQICVIYSYTGFEKLKGMSWWDGTALWSVLANPQMVAVDMSFIRSFPTLIAILSFVTIVFEIYFVPAIVSKRLKIPWMIVGILFHMSIGILMGLLPFSLAMLSTYFLFVNPLILKQKIVSIWDALRNIFSSQSLTR